MFSVANGNLSKRRDVVMFTPTNIEKGERGIPVYEQKRTFCCGGLLAKVKMNLL